MMLNLLRRIVLVGAISLGSALAHGQTLLIKSVGPGSMLTGPNTGKPCLNITVSGASTVASGVHPYSLWCDLSSDDKQTSVRKTLNAYIAFSRGRDELVQIPFSLLAPRFTSRVFVMVSLGFGGAEGFGTCYVPLPIVMVPGIAPEDRFALGGDGTWSQLESWLDLRYGQKISARQGAADRYPTLSTLLYNRNLDSLATAATKLRTEVNLRKTMTYADKVIIIAHSKGTLVTRKYFATYGTQDIKSALLVQGPHTGSVLAKFPNLGLYFPLGGDYTNLYPTYPSVYSEPRGVPTYSYSPVNPELDGINQDPKSMPTTIPVWLAVTPHMPTPFFHELNSLLPALKFVDGDIVVPLFSQLGKTYEPLLRRARLVPAFVPWSAAPSSRTVLIFNSHLTSMSSFDCFGRAIDPFLIETLRSRR